MKRLLITIVLTCALSTTALAGEIPTVGDGQRAPAPGDIDMPAVAATIVLTIVSLIR